MKSRFHSIAASSNLIKLEEKLVSVGKDEQERLLLKNILDDYRSQLLEEKNKEEFDFSDFSYYPELVFIINSNNRIVYQNRPIHGKINIVGRKLNEVLLFLEATDLVDNIKDAKHKAKVISKSIVSPVDFKKYKLEIKPYSRFDNEYMLVFVNRIEEYDNPSDSLFIQNKPQKHNLNSYNIIANSISDIFFILDLELNFTFITPSAEKALQYQQTELIGQDFDILIPAWSGNTLKSKLETTVQTDFVDPQRYVMQLSGKYGELNWYEVQVSGIYVENGNMLGYNGVCRDITERLKYEEALQLAKRKAEESDQIKSAFLANMSHEIRTPLNGIVGFANMLTNKLVPDDKKAKYAEYIVSSSRQLLALISDIIDISKIEARQLNIFSVDVQVNSMFNELLETINLEKERMERHDVKLDMQLARYDEIVIRADEVRLKQVLINLLFNALKFTRQGKISFGYTLDEKNNSIRFFVKDTGIGISDSMQKTIFERFRQGDLENTNKVNGTGLGLAISKGIIELMNGQIGVKSVKGIGSEFYFTLPLIN